MKNEKKRWKFEYLLTFLFLGVLFYIGGKNLENAIPEIEEHISDDEDYFEEGGTNLEEDYRLAFWERTSWVDSYGEVQRLLGRRIVGNFDFVLTEDRILDRCGQEENLLPFSKELGELKDMLDAKNIPLLYVQMPPREPDDGEHPDELFQTRSNYQKINAATADKQITRLDEEEIFADADAPDRGDFYFKTDIHTTTQGEIWMAEKIAEKLQNSFGITIPRVFPGSDPNYPWEKHTHPFFGNLAKSIGKKYVGTDLFESYEPDFPTQLRLEQAFGKWWLEGSYEEILMNNYDKLKKKDKMSIYWITNFLRYGEGGYHIENPGSSGPSLLVFCDSLCYRTLSYLSLGCSNITVLDPRFYPKKAGDPVQMVMSEKSYDAVIYLHGTFFTTDYSMFGRGAFFPSEEAKGMPDHDE